jgi:penicillin amidase
MRFTGYKLLAAVVALPFLAAGGAYLWLRHASLPMLSGTLPLTGLLEEVVVEREPGGILHIRAQNDRDLFFAQGVAHAQDRLWQMEFQRRVGAGRLAEVLGPEALSRDRYLRTWGFHRAARTAYEHLGAEAKALIDAYAAGINAYLATDPPLPPEFRLLGIRPERWTAPDVLVWSKLMAYNLAGNRRAELRRYRLLARGLTPERIAALMPLYPGESLPGEAQSHTRPSAVPAAEWQSGDLLALDVANRDHLPQASNNWVVHGSRTRSSLPLLANDVHLGMQLPSTWHLMHLRSPGFDVIGATLPGLPLVIVGRNRDIAWGVTNLGADVEDLYLLTERDGGYLYGGQIQPFETREELIKVRDAAPMRIRVRESLFGPVISDLVEKPAAAPPMALRWTGLDPDDTTFEAFLGINRAQNWNQFRSAMERYVSPGQSFVYADRAGHVGFLASGRVPLRRPGHSGLYPVPGDGEWDWRGYIPAAELPSRLNPPEGMIVTANQRIAEAGYPHRISYEWGANNYRAERIEQLLRQRKEHDRASTQALQQDTVTLLYRELRPVLEADKPRSDASREWISRLLAWDGDAGVNSTESTVFHAWYRELSTLPAEETGTRYWSGYPRFLVRALTEGDPACNAQEDGCRGFASRALQKALERLGDDPPRWGELHRAHLPHAVLTNTPLKALSDRVLNHGGSPYTVNSGGYRQEDWVMHHGASYRQIIDLAQPERSTFVIAGGQSGNWLSKGYGDQLPLWQQGQYLPMRRKGYEVADRLVLTPAP